MTDTLLSGGCHGGDFEFDACAKKVGHDIKHYSFLNHHLDTKGNAIILNEMQLIEADPYLQRANQTLKRRIPRMTNHYVTNLLRRNYWQIKETERVYAVAPINLESGLIIGGTGWAVQMAVDRRLLEIYVFDLNSNLWHVWKEEDFLNGIMKPTWVAIISPPKPHGTYTGIGSREITEDGIEAIRKLYV